jgi:membrane-associated protease RseP (regulator of RpoE activity)
VITIMRHLTAILIFAVPQTLFAQTLGSRQAARIQLNSISASIHENPTGLHVEPISSNAKGLPIKEGVVVRYNRHPTAPQVFSPAANAGINVGDIITNVDGHDIKSIEDYVAALKGLQPGPCEIVRYAYSRQAQKWKLGTVTLFGDSAAAPKASKTELKTGDVAMLVNSEGATTVAIVHNGDFFHLPNPTKVRVLDERPRDAKTPTLTITGTLEVEVAEGLHLGMKGLAHPNAMRRTTTPAEPHHVAEQVPIAPSTRRRPAIGTRVPDLIPNIDPTTGRIMMVTSHQAAVFYLSRLAEPANGRPHPLPMCACGMTGVGGLHLHMPIYGFNGLGGMGGMGGGMR